MESMNKTLILSVTLDDCRVDTFRSGGKGGQNQNKVSSGVRIVHELSGAVGEARDSRDQLHNKRSAFKRMVEKPEFKKWLRIETSRRCGNPTPEQLVEETMRPENIRIEVRNAGGQWVQDTS